MESLTYLSAKTSSPRFTHLKVYSSYSLGVGLNTPAEICAHAKQLGYSSVAITDTGSTYGFVEMHVAAARHGLKPIYGIVVEHRSAVARGDERFSATLLAVTPEGLRHIAALAGLVVATSEAGTAVDLSMLNANGRGLVAFAGAADSEVAKLLLEGDEDGARRVVDRFKDIYGDRFFIEVQDHGVMRERALAQKLLDLSSDVQVAPVLTREVRYAEKGMRDLYGTLRGVRHPAEERDFFRIDREPADWSMKSPLEMAQLRAFYEAAFDNTRRVDEMIPGDLLDEMEAAGHARKDPAREGEVREEIVERCVRALRERFGEDMGTAPSARRAVLDGEIRQALSRGQGSTLLLFHRVLSRLRESHVDLGPATGLSLQSLSAYLLGITCFDPYGYDPEYRPALGSRAVEAGEFELQLTGETRIDAVHALFSMFGVGEVAYVPAIERVTPAKAVRMAASVVRVPDEELREAQHIIGLHPGVSIERMYDENWRLAHLYRRSLAVRDLLTRAALLEDLPVGVVRSRRSLVLSPVPLTNFLGYSIDSETGDLFVQAGRDNFPAAGVFRLDITSLGALSVAVRTEKALRDAGVADYGWEGFPLDDGDVWRQIQTGDTAGVFLFDGHSTPQLRESFPLGSMNDLTNFLALIRLRDGEQSLNARIDAFHKGGTDGEVGDDGPEAILRSTRGQILYDEQLRDLVCAISGKTPAEAWDMVFDLRSGVPGALSKVRSQFMVGAADRGVPMDAANEWFERLLYHSKGTINRLRVFADALLVYKLFFLKQRHEHWFFASLLNSNVENEDKFAKYMIALRARGMVLGVDVNRSGVFCAVEDDKIRLGFCAVAGLGEEKSERIVAARAKEAFRSLEDFVRKLEGKHITREDIGHLIHAGAFDGVGEDRRELRRRSAGAASGRKRRSRGGAQGQLELPFDK